MKYVTIVEMYLVLHRAMKTNDVDLYADVLYELTPLFFHTNHHNYARWMSFFALKLSNVKKEQPYVYEVLIDGAFSVNRTGKAFSETGVDMCLEQTINADAKSRLKGIIPFADVSSAVNRWVVTSATRTQIVNQLLEVADMKNSQAETKDLGAPRMKKDKMCLKNIKEIILSSVNPFSANINKDGLFNLKTGKQASEETEKYLLGDSEEKRNSFVTECIERGDRFEEPIKKTKTMNFTLSNFKNKNKSAKVGKIAQAKGTRDLYGRLLYLSVQMQFDLHHVLSFPILPEPPCFALPDGTIRGYPKSKVFHSLKAGLKSTPPEKICVFIADGMFLVHALIGTSPTYGVLARKLLLKVMKETTERADICFDCFNSPSIKDVERKERGDVDSVRLFSIGPKVKIEKDISSLLKLSSFKNELIRFLSAEYEDDKYAPIIGKKIFICAINNEAKRYTCTDSTHVRTEIIPELYGSHEEADTRVAFHAKHADTFNPGNIVVRGNDTDIAIILVTNAHHFTKSKV